MGLFTSEAGDTPWQDFVANGLHFSGAFGPPIELRPTRDVSVPSNGSRNTMIASDCILAYLLILT